MDVRAKEGLATAIDCNRQPSTAFAVLEGEEPPELVEIAAGNVKFLVDVRKGHKTGFYLDQRDARKAVGELANGAEVLNCFCYTGGLEPTSDNLDVMIKAFAKVIKQYPEYELRLYGNPSPENKRLFEDVALNAGVVDKVKFMFDNAAINNSPEMLFEGHDTDIDGNTGNVLAVGRLEGTYTYGD